MDTDNTAPGYHIWGVDNTAYGPVELPQLVNWLKDDRVLADTWVFVERDGEWLKAADVPELKMFFRPKSPFQTRGAASIGRGAPGDVKPGDLRRIKALAEMADDQLGALLTFMEIVCVSQFAHVAKRGDPPDAMYGVLEGELRSCIIVEGKEYPIATLGPGSIFGEISLFDRGPHTVTVISNMDSLLIKFSNASIARITKEMPDVGLALLFGLIKSIAGRVRTLTRRYEDSVQVTKRTVLPPPGMAMAQAAV